jgi:30S ribosomal protein S31
LPADSGYSLQPFVLNRFFTTTRNDHHYPARVNTRGTDTHKRAHKIGRRASPITRPQSAESPRLKCPYRGQAGRGLWRTGRSRVESAPFHTRSNTMGKGDKRTKRGKIFRSSYGNTRPQGSKAKKSATGSKAKKKS